MLDRPPSRWLFVLALIAAGLFGGLGLAVVASMPRVTSVSPADGAQHISGRTPIQVSFNRPMHQASAQAALRLVPDWPGTFAWAGNTLTFAPQTPWPAESTVTVTLAGARSQRGLPLLGRHAWSFSVGGARFAYLLGEPANVWIADLDATQSPRQITDEAHGVYDFDASPDGQYFIYSAMRADGGAGLRRVNLDGGAAAEVLVCPGAACLSPVMALDGRHIAYERHTLVASAAGEMTLADPRVHLYTLADGADTRLGEAEFQARFPRWTPDGRLSYYDVARQAFVVQDLATGALTFIPNTSGSLGTWSPDGRYVVFPEIFFPPEPTHDPALPDEDHVDRFFSHLLRVTIATNQAENLSGPGVVEDASPVYSPSGKWLAFARRGLEPNQWTPGRQLWLMQADGAGAHPLTNEPFYNHSAFVWSPDEKTIVYMRFNVADPSEPAEIWRIDAAGGGAIQLVAGGFLPKWLP